MEIGFLTSVLPAEMPFKDIVAWAGKTGFSALEVKAGSSGHLKPADVLADKGAVVKRLLAEHKIRISSLAYYSCFDHNNIAAYQAEVRDLIAMAEILGTCVCALSGFPAPGKSKMDTIRNVVPTVFTPLAEEAQKRGVRIAFENWFATCLQHLDHFRALTEVLPQPNIGFNFDPSHLCWQEIDYLAAVEEFQDRIFHTHAKDTFISEARRARIGVLEGGWWQYVIPGFGVVRWGEYIHTLRKVGYNGVLSIEHEDGAFSPQEGLTLGLKYLSRFV